MSRGWQAFWLAVSALVCLAAAPAGVALAVVSPLAFYGQGRVADPLSWATFLLFDGFWIACILGPLGARAAFVRRRTALSWIALAWPFAWGFVVAITLWLILR